LQEDDVMKARILIVAGLAAMMALSGGAFAEETSFQVQGGDTVKSVLERSAGQTVGLRVEGGEELRGKVGRVGDHVVQLTDLSGREFFDAVVPLDAIQAVVVKVRSK
jgi:exosome complex RNA-binding protein Csl4